MTGTFVYLEYPKWQSTRQSPESRLASGDVVPISCLPFWGSYWAGPTTRCSPTARVPVDERADPTNEEVQSDVDNPTGRYASAAAFSHLNFNSPKGLGSGNGICWNCFIPVGFLSQLCYGVVDSSELRYRPSCPVLWCGKVYPITLSWKEASLDFIVLNYPFDENATTLTYYLKTRLLACLDQVNRLARYLLKRDIVNSLVP